MIVDARTEIADRDFCAKVRAALRDPDVAVAGRGRRARRPHARVVGRRGQRGAGRAPLLRARRRRDGGLRLGAAHGAARRGRRRRRLPARAVAVGGAERALRRVARTGHGFDVDYCLQVREAGRKVVTADLRAIHHRTLELVSDFEIWVEGHIHLAEKWDGRWPGREPRGGLEAPRPPRRGRARGGADVRLLEREPARRRGARAGARDGGDDGQPVVAADRAAAVDQPRAPSSSTRLTSSREITD